MLTVRKATAADLEKIMQIYETAREFMIRNGNPTQWEDGYPQRELVGEDIRTGICRVICDGETPCGVFAFLEDEDPWYRRIEDGQWSNDEPYVAIHRIGSDGTRHGIFRCAADYAKAHCDNVRIDTHKNNHIMQKLITGAGFTHCGTIFVVGNSPRIAYQWTREA